MIRENSDKQRETPDIESSSEEYARRFEGEVGRWLLEVQERATQSLLEGADVLSVLDVGGGHGQNLPGLTGRGCRVTVFGSAASCSGRIRRYLESGEVSFREGNLVALPFEDRSFDVAISYRMLTHLTQWKRLVGELARVSRRSVLVDFPSTRSVNVFAERFFSLKKKIEKNTRRYRVFREERVVEEFGGHDFDPMGRYAQFFLPMALHRFMGSRALSAFSEGMFRRVGLTALLGSPVIIRFDRSPLSKP